MITKIETNITLIKGNLFDHVEQYINVANNGCSVVVPHVCNNISVFGGGFTKELSDKYPIVKENYQLLGKKFLQQNFGYSQFIEVLRNKEQNYRLVFANMIAQNGIISPKNKRPLNYCALVKSMVSVSNYVHTMKKACDHDVTIHCPKFGCGLAGGNWNFIKDLISDIWSKHRIFVYQL